jgi:hypothetical protein
MGDVIKGGERFVKDTIKQADRNKGAIIGGTAGFLVGGPWGAAIGAGLGSQTDGAAATDRAVDAQADATKDANRTMLQMYNQTREDMTPWRTTGEGALKDLKNNNILADGFEGDPGYQFRMSEGMKAINAAASARGMAGGGATMKALTRYGQDYASNEYNNAYGREYNRLSQLAGFGGGAMNAQAQNNQNYGNTVSNNQIGMGNAQAAAYMGEANRQSQLLGQGMGAAAMYYGGAKFSDERLKTDIKPVAKSELKELKKLLKAYTFRYKNPVHGEGEYVGVMAQDLEQSRLGKTLVITDKDGFKQIDMNRVLMLFLSTLAEG